MTTEALDFYAYWNGAQVADLWTTLALITGTDDYRSLLLCVALFGLICAAAGAAVRYRGGDLIVWIAAMVFIFSAAFVPRVNIAVRDVRSANVQVVQNIPLGIGWPASVISRASYWLTESFETAFGDVDAARYTRFGVAFPQRVVTTMLSVKPITADGKMSLTNFTERCIVPEILENSVKRQELLNAPDINALISTNGWVNPARRVFMNNKVLTCTEAAEELKKTLEKTEIPALESRLRLKLNVDFKDGVNAALSTAIPQAESLMLGVSRTMAESLRQSLMMSAIPDTTMTFAAKAGQAPLSAGVAIARSQGNLASEINYRTLSEMARSALPKLRNILEFTVIGLWPMVFLMMLGTGAGGAMVCRAYFTLLISVSLWAPITAIINYLTLHLDMEPMNQLVNSAGGVTLAAATMIRDAGATSQAMAGSLLWLVPVLAYAVAKGSDMALTAMTSSVLAPASSAAQAQGSQLAMGNVSAGNASLNNASLNNVSGNKTDTSSSWADPNTHKVELAQGTAAFDRSAGQMTAMNVRKSDLGVSSGMQNTHTTQDANNFGTSSVATNASSLATNSGVQSVSGNGVTNSVNRDDGWSVTRNSGTSYPKISDFGAVDDEGKRSFSLWHKQTPGIPGVDFHLERLYNILQSWRFQKWPIRTQKPPSRNVPTRTKLKGCLPMRSTSSVRALGMFTFPIASVRTGSASRSETTSAPCRLMERSFCRTCTTFRMNLTSIIARSSAGRAPSCASAHSKSSMQTRSRRSLRASLWTLNSIAISSFPLAQRRFVLPS